MRHAPAAHACVLDSGPVRPGQPSAVRVRLMLPYPQSTEQLLHPLHAPNPLDPHCCVAVKGPAAHDGPHVPATHVRPIVCTPPNPHDTLHALHDDHAVKWFHVPDVQFASSITLPPPQSPQRPLPHVRVWFVHPAPHVTLHAPNPVHAVHDRGVPTLQLNVCVPLPLHVPHVPLPHVRLCDMVPVPHVLEHADSWLHADHVTGVPVLQDWDVEELPVHGEPQLPRQVRVAICVPVPHPMHGNQSVHWLQ